MKRTSEPFFWSLFGAGGALSALFFPALLLLTGIAFPLGWLTPSYENLNSLADLIVTRLLLVGIISLSMFHWAHRFRFTLEEGLQLKKWDKAISVFCYGSAFVVSIFAVWTLIFS